MEFIKTEIDGVWIIEPKVFNDDRGYFFESFKQAEFDKNVGYHVDFIQDNESKSSYGVLRGLHYQEGDTAQAKLVRVIKGKVVDVAVDLRKSSPTFGSMLWLNYLRITSVSSSYHVALHMASSFFLMRQSLLIRWTMFTLHRLKQVFVGMMRL